MFSDWMFREILARPSSNFDSRDSLKDLLIERVVGKRSVAFI